MRIAKIGFVGAMMWLGAALAPAQEGHPLVGAWHGNWGVTDKDRNDITVVMMWDGKEITGMINPGLDAGKLQKASLNPANWTVHFEADMKDRSGAMVHITADGKLEDLTNVRRSLSGTWVQGPVKGDFRIKRDN
ncbi:MAG TPA: hypothetical protein VN841_25640 [Bryobacteraceae bacterium]|nr:hypothetical protein [Bryobacteraceae bacterium]